MGLLMVQRHEGKAGLVMIVVCWAGGGRNWSVLGDPGGGKVMELNLSQLLWDIWLLSADTLFVIRLHTYRSVFLRCFFLSTFDTRFSNTIVLILVVVQKKD